MAQTKCYPQFSIFSTKKLVTCYSYKHKRMIITLDNEEFVVLSTEQLSSIEYFVTMNLWEELT